MLDTVDESLSWDGVSGDMARQIAQQGETFLQAQLQAGLAADQRAITIASIFVTFATAVLGAALAYWQQSNDWPLLMAGIAASAALSVGACYGFWAARPITFHFPGNHPAKWWPCRKTTLAIVLGGESENYQECIEHNEGCLQANAQALALGAKIATATPVLAGVAWFITFLVGP